MSNRNMNGETFEEFMASVDKLISKTLWGLTSSHLADVNTRDLWNDGVTHRYAAQEIMKNDDLSELSCVQSFLDGES